MRIQKLPEYFGSIEAVMAPYVEHRVATNSRQYWHIKRGGTILLVAHIDTVLPPQYRGAKDGKIYGVGLDDRLGVFMAVEAMRYRKDVDVLICDDEEIGQSTADMVDAKTLERYNIIIESDRAGTDFVDYDLASDDVIDFVSTLRPYSFGAFSDISSLPYVDRSMINLGVGYHHAHSETSYAVYSEIVKAWSDLHTICDRYTDSPTEAPVFVDDYKYQYWQYDYYKPRQWKDEVKELLICTGCDTEYDFFESLSDTMCATCLEALHGEDWEDYV